LLAPRTDRQPTWAKEVMLKSSVEGGPSTARKWSMVIPISRYYEYWQREYMPWWSECVRGLMMEGRRALQEGGPWTDSSLGRAISTIVYPTWLSGLERHIPLSEVAELSRRYDHGEAVSLPGPYKDTDAWLDRRRAAFAIMQDFEGQFGQMPTCPDWICCGGCSESRHRQTKQEDRSHAAWSSFPSEDDVMTHEWSVISLRARVQGESRREAVRVVHALPSRGRTAADLQSMMLAMRVYMILVAMEPEDIELLVRESAAGLMQAPRLRTLMIPPRVPLPIMLDVVKGIGEKVGAQWVETYPDTAEPMRVWGSWFTMVAGMPAPGAEIVDKHKPEGQPEDEQETNWGLFRSHPWRWWETTRAKASETYWLDEVFAKYLWDRSTDMAEFPTGAVKVVVRTGRLLKPRQYPMGWDN